ncbi:MAG TPA: hypothetical protein VJL28_14595 [Gemmatimonadaceae bacterium]|nr:hypothetical protein [Gemmatimonadaceae bacterium]
MSRGRVTAYSRWRLTDYLLQRAAIPLVLVVLFAGLPVYGTLRSRPDLFDGPQGAMFARQLFTNSIVLFLPIGVFLAATGVISTDRQQGHFRFYFSKPVNVVAHYVQTYLLHGLVYVALFGAITWAYGAITAPQSVAAAMEAAALTFVLVGGLGFLLGALTRFDGALLVLVYVLSMAAQQLVAQSTPELPPPAWLTQLARLLPPVHTLDQLRNHFYAAEAVEASQLWHVLGYGAGAFGLGMVLLRRLPLAR